jgi:amino acid transporter
VASIFDMAIYPTLFVLYLSRLLPSLADLSPLLGAGLIAACAGWNMRGSRSVSGGAALMTVALLLPFAFLIMHALSSSPAPAAPLPAHGSLLAAMLVAMWNYMGWDNASTIAGEVERPQRTYPLAMLTAVALVAITYVLPVLALAVAGVDTRDWTTGSWVAAARTIGGDELAVGIVLGGVVCAVGMLNSLMMSYSRLPVVLAEDGFLPSWFARRHPATGAPWVAIGACALAYMAALRIGFERLVELDVMLYGLSLVLEFAALVALRLKEPSLPRPFRVPGGLAGAVAIAVPPAILIAIALWEGRHDRVGPVSALWLGALVIAATSILYALRRRMPAPAVI